MLGSLWIQHSWPKSVSSQIIIFQSISMIFLFNINSCFICHPSYILWYKRLPKQVHPITSAIDQIASKHHLAWSFKQFHFCFDFYQQHRIKYLCKWREVLFIQWKQKLFQIHYRKTAVLLLSSDLVKALRITKWFCGKYMIIEMNWTYGQSNSWAFMVIS